MNKIRAVLTSFGMSGRVFHAPLIDSNEKFILHGILERQAKGSKEIYPDVKIYTHFEEVLDDPNVELLVINTPDDSHYELCKKALQSKKHLVVEKPYTLSFQEATELNLIAEQNNCYLSVFHNRRWDSDFLTVKKVLSAGHLGRLIEYEAHYDRYRTEIQQESWKDSSTRGSGILYNLGSHLIDQALVLFGLPEWLTADIRKVRASSPVPDYFILNMHYKNHNVLLRSSYLVPEPGPKYIIHGEKGSFIKSGADPQEAALAEGRSPIDLNYGKETADIYGEMITFNKAEKISERIRSEQGNYQAFYDELYQAIRNGQELPVKGDEAALVIKIIEAAISSSNTGKRIEIESYDY